VDVKQVAYEWANDMGVNSGAKLLIKINALDGAIDVYAHCMLLLVTCYGFSCVYIVM
jgi:hypothetical protein